MNEKSKTKNTDDLPVAMSGTVFGVTGVALGLGSAFIFPKLGLNFIGGLCLIILSMSGWIFGWWYKLRWLKIQKHPLYKEANLEFRGNASFYLTLVAGSTAAIVFTSPEGLYSTNQFILSNPISDNPSVYSPVPGQKVRMGLGRLRAK